MVNKEGNGDSSAADLLVESFEISVRTSMRMMKLPLVVYAGMVNSWAKAVDSMLEDLEADD